MTDTVTVTGQAWQTTSASTIQALRDYWQNAWDAELLQLVQQSIEEDTGGATGGNINFAGYMTSDGEKIDLKYSDFGDLVEDDDGEEIEQLEVLAYNDLQEMMGGTFENPVPIIVEFDANSGDILWDFLIV